MSERPDAEPLAAAVLDLLTAIRDALTVPRPARGDDFAEWTERRRQREELIADRAATVRIAATVGIDAPGRHLAETLDYLTRTIRESTAALPAEYEVRPEMDGGES